MATPTLTAAPLARPAPGRASPAPPASCRHGDERARTAVGLAQLVEVARRGAVDAAEHVLDRRRDVEEADPALEERLHRHLVGGVVRARVRPAFMPASRPSASIRKVSRSGSWN